MNKYYLMISHKNSQDTYFYSVLKSLFEDKNFQREKFASSNFSMQEIVIEHFIFLENESKKNGPYIVICDKDSFDAATAYYIRNLSMCNSQSLKISKTLKFIPMTNFITENDAILSLGLNFGNNCSFIWPNDLLSTQNLVTNEIIFQYGYSHFFMY